MSDAGTTVVSIIFVLGALLLAVRGLQGHRLSFGAIGGMAAAWIVIILVLVFILDRFVL